MLEKRYAIEDGFDMIRKGNLFHSNARQSVSRITPFERDAGIPERLVLGHTGMVYHHFRVWFIEPSVQSLSQIAHTQVNFALLRRI